MRKGSKADLAAAAEWLEGRAKPDWWQVAGPQAPSTKFAIEVGSVVKHNGQQYVITALDENGMIGEMKPVA